ncbi:hypothetical protein D805_0031 [Bifidobacterium thermophilum RBL67]|uniref:Uncharacterized protein n=1 Tax=Bifidobacterium thermophilum RBL67 TaxID=1254439 RepID=M4RCP7_9BIFI|nr:hypothetical protein D805_0031 [Bifidobacterium thermophilum RBL67]
MVMPPRKRTGIAFAGIRGKDRARWGLGGGGRGWGGLREVGFERGGLGERIELEGLVLGEAGFEEVGWVERGLEELD